MLVLSARSFTYFVTIVFEQLLIANTNVRIYGVNVSAFAANMYCFFFVIHEARYMLKVRIVCKGYGTLDSGGLQNCANRMKERWNEHMHC